MASRYEHLYILHSEALERCSFENADQIPTDFVDYVLNTPGLSSWYATLLVGTLPGNRYEFYSEYDYKAVINKVLGTLDKMDEALGFFNLSSYVDLLAKLETYDDTLVFLGLIFNILLLIFVAIAVLLVYSLLMISVETKSF